MTSLSCLLVFHLVFLPPVSALQYQRDCLPLLFLRQHIRSCPQTARKMTTFESFMNDKGLAYPASPGEQDPQSLFDQFLNHDSAEFLVDCTRPEPSSETDFNFDFDEDTTTNTSEGHSASSANTLNSIIEQQHSQNQPQTTVERAAALRPHRAFPRSGPPAFDPLVTAKGLLNLEGKVVRPPSPVKAGSKSLRRKSKHSSTTDLEKSANRVSKAKSNDKMHSSYHHEQERPSYPDWTQRFQQISLQHSHEQAQGSLYSTDLTSPTAAGASEDPHGSMHTPLQASMPNSATATPQSKLRHAKSHHGAQTLRPGYHQQSSPSRLDTTQSRPHFPHPEDSPLFVPHSPYSSTISHYHSQEFIPPSALHSTWSAAEENRTSFFANAQSYDEQMADYPDHYPFTFPHYSLQQSNAGYAIEEEEALSPHSLPHPHHQREGYLTFGFPPPPTPHTPTATSTPPPTPLSPTTPLPAHFRAPSGKDHTPTSSRRRKEGAGKSTTSLRGPKSTPHLSTVTKTPSKSSLRSPRSAGTLKRTHGHRNLHSVSITSPTSTAAPNSSRDASHGHGHDRRDGNGHERQRSGKGSGHHPPHPAHTPHTTAPTSTSHARHASNGARNPSTTRTHSKPQAGSPNAIGFVNFTPSDSTRILTGVAPSGSSKTKARREQEAAERKRRLSMAAERAVREAGGDVGGLREVLEL